MVEFILLMGLQIQCFPKQCSYNHTRVPKKKPLVDRASTVCLCCISNHELLNVSAYLGISYSSVRIAINLNVWILKKWLTTTLKVEMFELLIERLGKFREASKEKLLHVD